MDENDLKYAEKMAEMRRQRIDSFARGKSTLGSQTAPKLDKIDDVANMKAKSLNMPEIEPGQFDQHTSGDLWKAKIDRIREGRKAGRIAQDAALEAGSSLDYRALKRMASKVGRRGLKAIPLIGGIASALQSGDVSAAVPVFGDSDSVGMSPQDENVMLAEQQARKDYNNSPAAEARKKALLEMALRKN